MATDLNYLKRAILTLALSADERDAPDLGARFYSYDKQSGKFIVRLIDEEDQPIDLSQFAIINMVMAPNRDISKGRTIVPMQAEDPEDGVVSVILPDNIRQFNGTIIAGVVAMNADNIKTHDFGYFRFEMQQSLIDANIENLSDFYVGEFEQLREQIHQIMQDTLDDIAAFKLNINAQLQELQNKINAARIDLDTLIAAINAAKINTKNVFDTSLLLTPEYGFRRRVNGQTIDLRVWGTALFNNAATMQMFEPNKKYHAKYVAELLTLTGGSTQLSGHFGMCIYSGKTGFPTVWIVDGLGTNASNLKVGDKVTLEKTFTTPTELYNPDANYQILGYSRRDDNSVIDAVRFHDVMIQEGTIFTGFQNNPNNELTRFDKDRLKQNLHPDPLMTGSLPIRNKDSAIEITWDANGWLTARNTDTSATRRFWYDPTNELTIPVDSVTRPLAVAVRLRATLSSTITIGYASGENLTYTSTGGNDWVWVTGIIKPVSSTGISVYISPNANCIIDEFNIYYAEITNSSNELNKLPAIAKTTIDTPDNLTSPDANTMLQSGVWKAYAGTNFPPMTGNQYYYVRVINFNVNNCIQFVSLREGAGDTHNPNYVRQCVNGNWSPWRKIQTILPDDKVDVNNGVDFNTIKRTGWLVSNTPVNAPTPTVGLTWYLETIAYGASNAMQRATMVNENNRTYTRQYVNAKWTDWQLDVKEGGLLATRDQGTDLNDFVTNMSFMIYAPLNAPMDGTYIWYIEVSGYNVASCKQRAVVYGTSNREWTRQKVNNVWTPWREVADLSSNQTVGGLKNFTTRPTVNGAQVATNVEPTPLTGTVNWDSFDQPGRWYMSGIANGPKYLSNYGYLEVTAHPNSVAAIQTYTDIDDNCIMRTRKSVGGVPTWGTWKVVRLELPYTELTFASGWRNYATEPTAWGYAAVSRSGNVCQLLGVVSNTVDFTPSNAQVPMAYVPEGYRPKISTYGTIKRSSGRTMYTCEVTTEGTVTSSAMVDPGVNGYASTQPPGRLFHIGLTYIGEDIAFF